MAGKMNAGMYSSANSCTETPPDLFALLDKQWRFKIDLAASRNNALCDLFFDEKQDSLSQKWKWGPAFLNPPYGNGIEAWVKKAFMDVRKYSNSPSVLLLPARTDTNWFQEWVLDGADEVIFLKGRIQFWFEGEPIKIQEKKNAEYTGRMIDCQAPFPSAIATYAPWLFNTRKFYTWDWKNGEKPKKL